MESFVPAGETARTFRDALGRYATGVTVVTTLVPAGPLAITVNSFASVSLDPPLVLWCPARRSQRFDAFLAARRYSIHVLAAGQLELGLHFARAGTVPEGLDAAVTPEGDYHLEGCLARFDCTAESRHDGGDHAILVGRVHRAAMRDGDPLLFWGGRYGDFLQHGV